MIVVGGLTSEDLLCDQPGVYIYNTTSEWNFRHSSRLRISRLIVLGWDL